MPSALSDLRVTRGITKFTNCRILKGEQLVTEDLWISSESGKIIDSQIVFYDHHAKPDRVLDLGGKIISPGFIEVQINGAFGFDFSVIPEDISSYVKGVKRVNQGLIKTGVTSYLPTLTSQAKEVYQYALPFLSPSGTHRIPSDGAEILGAHCEGPFISPTKNGIHSKSVLRSAPNGYSDIEDCYGSENLRNTVKMVTLAPELTGTMDCIARLAAQNVIVSVGHSEATYEEATKALDQGATMITHLFNAMRPIHHRDPGIFGVLGTPDQAPQKKPYFGVIADGVHLHPTSVNISWSASPSGLILVTDAMRTLGLPNGTYSWTNGETFTKTGHLLVLDGSDGKLAGTSIELIECVNNFLEWTGASLAQALGAVTIRPATMMGLDKSKGVLCPGADADLVILDDVCLNGQTKLEVKEVWKFGECVSKS